MNYSTEQFVYNSSMLSFSTNILVSYILTPLIIYRILYRTCYRTADGAKPFFVLAAFGIGPLVPSLLLYYLFLLVPGRPVLFYLINVFLVLAMLYVTVRVSPRDILAAIKTTFVNDYGRLVRWALMVAIAVFCVVWLCLVVETPIIRHDVFEYATLAKLFARDRKIVYSEHLFDPVTQFYYVGRHGFFFPLIASWERLVNSALHIDSDLFFKSISGYYLLLIVLGQLLVFHKKRPLLALFVPMNTLLVTALVSNLVYFHLDTVRLFFIGLCTLFVYYFMYTKSPPILYLLGVCLGLGLNIHATALMFAAVMFPIVVFIPQGFLAEKLKRALALGGLIIMFGGIHYILDLFIGRGLHIWIS